MSIVRCFREKGIRRVIKVLYKYKLQIILNKIFILFLRNRPLQNIIMIESHNDFDMNGGTLYDYLIKKHFNNKYKIVWLVKNKINGNHEKATTLPPNVVTVPLYRPSVRKAYYNCIAKFAFFDCYSIEKLNKAQTFVYLGHATRAMKNCRGLIDLPAYIDYIVSSASFNNELMSDIYKADIDKFVVLGFPVTDKLFLKSNEMAKFNDRNTFGKVIMWMPTFRRTSFLDGRNDCDTGTKTGIPMIEDPQQFMELNTRLIKMGIKLIVKFHQAQNMSDITVKNTSNICLLSPEAIKEYGIDTYKLLTQTDALISDYSSISFDYLLLDKPIAYVLGDYHEYKLGFAVENPFDYMPGAYIYNLKDLYAFMERITSGEDMWKEKRNILKNKIHKYQDGKSCERIVDFLRL